MIFIYFLCFCAVIGFVMLAVEIFNEKK